MLSGDDASAASCFLQLLTDMTSRHYVSTVHAAANFPIYKINCLFSLLSGNVTKKSVGLYDHNNKRQSSCEIWTGTVQQEAWELFLKIIFRALWIHACVWLSQTTLSSLLTFFYSYNKKVCSSLGILQLFSGMQANILALTLISNLLSYHNFVHGQRCIALSNILISSFSFQ